MPALRAVIMPVWHGVKEKSSLWRLSRDCFKPWAGIPASRQTRMFAPRLEVGSNAAPCRSSHGHDHIAGLVGKMRIALLHQLPQSVGAGEGVLVGDVPAQEFPSTGLESDGAHMRR